LPQLRKDPVVGRWVIIATERSRRPTNFAPVSSSGAAQFCPFCAGQEDKTPQEVYAVRPPEAGEGPGADPEPSYAWNS
jgi:UDPglucose--hexose-1-phosphate uridylyltransferase